MKRCSIAGMAAGLWAAAVALGAFAQTYPARPLRIVSSEPGGGNDFGARVIAQALTGTIGQCEPGIPRNPPWAIVGGYWSLSGPGSVTCVADVDDGSGSGVPDGGVTIDDLLYFLLRYEAGC